MTPPWRSDVRSTLCPGCDRWFVTTSDYLEFSESVSYAKTTSQFGLGADYDPPDVFSLVRTHLRGGP